MKRLIKNLINEYQHLIYIVLIGILIALTFTVFKDSFVYLFYSFKSFIQNFIYYFAKMFRLEYYVEKQPLDYLLEYHDGNYFSLLPIDWDVFVIKIKALFGSSFNKEYMEYYFYRFLFKVANLCRYLIIIFMFVPFIIVYFDNYFAPVPKAYFDKEFFVDFDNEDFKKSKELIYYERFRNRVLDSIREFVFNFKEFTLSHRYYLYIVICLLAFDFKLFSVVIDVFGVVFYLGATLEIVCLFNFIATVFVYLSPILIKIPLPVYIVLGYIIFDLWRISVAYNILEHNENKNKGFINSLGILNMFIGPPGVGKTTILTDITLSQEEIFRTKALDILTDVKSRFSMFPFAKFETTLKVLIDNGFFINRTQCGEYVKKKKERFCLNPDRSKIFDYDYERFGLYFYDGNVNEFIWDALNDYAQAYFMYIMPCPLSAANYSIRFDMQKIDYGHFPLWSYDYFRGNGDLLEYKSRYSKVLDQDSLRLGKKMIKNNPNAFVLDGCVITHPEVGKERGNQYDLAELKISDENANQKNDLFNFEMKIIRHLSTVRHIPFIKFIDDDQRSASTNADLRELHDMIITLQNTEDKFETCIPFYWFVPGILKSIQSKLEGMEKRFSNARSDETLIMYFVRFFLNKIKSFNEKRENIFDVKKVHMSISSGLNEQNLGDKIYYLSKKKIYSNRYNTDMYGAFFNDKYIKAKKGFMHQDEYKSYITDLDSLVKQNSYFVKRIVGLNTSEELKTEVEKVYRKLL